MSKVPDIDQFTIVVDTNALYYNEPLAVVSPKFTEAFLECASLAKLKLLVPEVVKGERLFQLVSVVQELIEVNRKNADKVTRLSGHRASKVPKLPKLKAGVEENFDKWAKSLDAVIVPIPYGNINWKKLVHKAIWRIPPFTPPNDKMDSEKGFRDALILETLIEIYKTRPTTKTHQMVFVTKDKQLATAVSKCFGAENVRIYGAMVSFASYLKIQKQTADEAFAKAVMLKAPDVFYTENDPECVYYKCEVEKRIKEQFQSTLDSFSEDEDAAGISRLIALKTVPGQIQFEKPAIYVPCSEDKVLLDSTEFASFPGNNDFEWKTRLRFVRVFKKQTPPPEETDYRLPFDLDDEKVRIQPFDVMWTSKVTEELKFTDIAIGEIFIAVQSSESGFLAKFNYGFGDDKPVQT
jgi:hypothetical protein